jgi:hypothetical protein
MNAVTGRSLATATRVLEPSPVETLFVAKPLFDPKALWVTFLLRVRRESLRSPERREATTMTVSTATRKRVGADLMFSYQRPTGYGGFRKELSKAPGQCNPA